VTAVLGVRDQNYYYSNRYRVLIVQYNKIQLNTKAIITAAPNTHYTQFSGTQPHNNNNNNNNNN